MLQAIRQKLIRCRMDHQVALERFRTEQKAMVEADEAASAAMEAQAVIIAVAQQIQEDVHQSITHVVSRCLEAIFDDPYEFKIEFDRKRGKTEATLTFHRNGVRISDPLFSCGGGVVDVASFALRLACIVLEKPPRRRVMVLDEPFTGIRGLKNRRRMRDLLISLSEDFEVQFILNIDTDAYPEFKLGKVIEIE